MYTGNTRTNWIAGVLKQVTEVEDLCKRNRTRDYFPSGQEAEQHEFNWEPQQ